MTTKIDIPLQGVALDDLMAVDENSVRVVEPSELAARRIEVDSAETAWSRNPAASRFVFPVKRNFDEYARDLADWEANIAPVRSSAAENQLSPWTEGAKTLLFIRVDFPDRQGEPVDRFGQVLTAAVRAEL